MKFGELIESRGLSVQDAHGLSVGDIVVADGDQYDIGRYLKVKNGERLTVMSGPRAGRLSVLPVDKERQKDFWAIVPDHLAGKQWMVFETWQVRLP